MTNLPCCHHLHSFSRQGRLFGVVILGTQFTQKWVWAPNSPPGRLTMQWMSCSLKQRVATTARIVSFAVCVLPIVAATSRAQGTITTVAGGGGLSSGPAITSPIGQPTAVAIDHF